MLQNALRGSCVQPPVTEGCSVMVVGVVVVVVVVEVMVVVVKARQKYTSFCAD